MNRSFLIYASTSVLCAMATFAQGEHAPTPAPELEKLNYFIGTWQTEADMKPGPMGPGGKYTSTDTYKWKPGKFFVTGTNTFKAPTGNGTELMTLGYDVAQKVYTYNAAIGDERHSATGTLEGDTLTWTSTEPSTQPATQRVTQPSPFKWHYIEKLVSPTMFTIKFETSKDGTNWSTVMEGKSVKQ